MAWITEPMYYLSYTQALNNAEIVFSEFNKSSIGLTKEAICGVLGNMWRESHVNPNMSEEGGGTTPAGAGAGLVQWTPATELTKHMSGSDTWNDGYFQMRVLIQELSPNNVNNGGSSYGQWYDVGAFTYAQFVTTSDVDYATECFMRCYERPGVTELAERIEYARKFYQDITGEVPSGDGTQLAVLPIHYINVTQGENGSFSHMGTYCIDFVGTTTRYPYYAPCDCTMVMRQDSAAVAIWASDREVKRVDGSVGYIFWSCIHEEPITHTVGTKLKKGELMGHTGIGGHVTGDHLHLQVMDGNNYQGFTVNSLGANTLIGTELHIYDVFSSCDNVTKEEFTIVNGNGYPWKCMIDWDDGGSPQPPDPSTGDELWVLLMVNALNGWYNY